MHISLTHKGIKDNIILFLGFIRNFLLQTSIPHFLYTILTPEGMESLLYWKLFCTTSYEKSDFGSQVSPDEEKEQALKKDPILPTSIRR